MLFHLYFCIIIWLVEYFVLFILILACESEYGLVCGEVCMGVGRKVGRLVGR